MGDEKLDYRLLRYNEYSKQRGELGKTNVDLSGRYDQWILTLAGGALLASVAFLEKIATSPAPNTIGVLGFAWLFLVVSLLSGFISLLTAQYSIVRQIEILDNEYKWYVDASKQNTNGVPDGTPPREDNKWTHSTHMLNIVSASTFILGIGFLCLFSFLNIPAGPSQVAVPPKIDVNVNFKNLPQFQQSVVNTNKP